VLSKILMGSKFRQQQQEVAPLKQQKRSDIKRHPVSLLQPVDYTCSYDCSKFLKSEKK
jgi:hypothetical protein